MTGPPSLLQRVLARVGRLTHQRPWLVLFVLGLSLVPSLWFASQLTVRSSFLDLLPADRSAVRQLNDVLGRAQVSSTLMVTIANDDPEAARRFALALSERLEGQPLVRAVNARVQTEFFIERQLLYLDADQLRELIARVRRSIDSEVGRDAFDLGLDEDDEPDEDELSPDEILRRLEAQIPVLEPWLVTADGRWLCVRVVFAGPSGDLDFSRRAYDLVSRATGALRAQDEFEGIDVRFSGGIAQRLADHEQMTEDLTLAGGLGFFAVVLLMVVSLRSPRALVLFSIPLAIGLAWTFATARLTVGHLNIISGFLFSILSGLGIEYGIHLHHRYHELRREGLSIEDATERLMATTGRALVAIGMTNASVFLVTAFADFSGFSEFGRIAAAGMLLTLVSTLFGFPALNVLFERWRPAKPRRDTAANRRIDLPRPLRIAILVVVPAAAIASAIVMFRGGVRFEGDWRVLQGDSEVARFDEYISDQLGGTFGNAVIWIRDPNDSDGLVEAVERVRQARAGSVWTVTGIQRLEDVVPPARLQAERLPLIAELRTQLQRVRPERLDTDAQRALLSDVLRWSEVRPFDAEDVPPSFLRGFRTVDGQGILLVVRTGAGLRETDAIIAWGEQVQAISDELARAGIEASILSENWIAAEIFVSIFADGPFLLTGALVAVFLVLLFDLRSARSATVVLGSVVIGMICIGGGMAAVGPDLNFMNAGILPVCIGISLDNAMHIYHRYRVEGRDAIPFVLRHTSSANLLSSLTNLMGFGALVVAEHRGLRSVALLAILGVSLTYVSTSIFFPLALQTFGRRRGPAPPTP